MPQLEKWRVLYCERTEKRRFKSERDNKNNNKNTRRSETAPYAARVREKSVEGQEGENVAGEPQAAASRPRFPAITRRSACDAQKHKYYWSTRTTAIFTKKKGCAREE